MPPQRYEIYLAKIRHRESTSTRPWVLVTDPVQDLRNPASTVVGAVPVSTKFDLFDERDDFPIRETDADFAGTGLQVNSYAIGAPVPTWIPVNMLGRYLGRLTGELLDDFKKWEENP